MLKSVCIKTNNNKIINYLLKRLEYFKISDIYFSCVKYKIYTNIIVHYKGKNYSYFLSCIAQMLTDTIVNFYEEKILRKIINSNYFYFSNIEQNQILDMVFENLKFEDSLDRKQIISSSFLEYFTEKKALVLDGFASFRLFSYVKYLDTIVDLCVNKFIIDREYYNFINLLKNYIESQKPIVSEIHLIYQNQEAILLDESQNLIPINENFFNAKYLSDISFSPNDFALNTLLTLLPKKLSIHLIDDEADDFIETLKLVFDNRVKICNNCIICKTYKAKANI